MWFGISYTGDGAWSNVVGQNRETNEEHEEDCAEERFHLAWIKFERDGEGG